MAVMRHVGLPVDAGAARTADGDGVAASFRHRKRL